MPKAIQRCSKSNNINSSTLRSMFKIALKGKGESSWNSWMTRLYHPAEIFVTRHELEAWKNILKQTFIYDTCSQRSTVPRDNQQPVAFIQLKKYINQGILRKDGPDSAFCVYFPVKSAPLLIDLNTDREKWLADIIKYFRITYFVLEKIQKL